MCMHMPYAVHCYRVSTCLLAKISLWTQWQLIVAWLHVLCKHLNEDIATSHVGLCYTLYHPVWLP